MIKHKLLILIAAVTALGLSQAGATFVKLVDGDPDGIKLWNDVANKNVTDFDAFVGQNNSGGHSVHIHTFGPVDSGSGYATIKPVKGGSLTDVIFTPDSSTTFSDFSFRGQLTDFGDGTVTLIVTDSLNVVTTFTFSGLGKNQDFPRQGIISEDGSFIKTVELQSDFKEIKQLDVSFGDPTRVPDGGTTVMLLGAALSVLGMARRYLKS
jgi:hypothetical protein